MKWLIPIAALGLVVGGFVVGGSGHLLGLQIDRGLSGGSGGAPGPGRAWWTGNLLVLGDPKTSGLPAWMGDVDAAPVAAYDFDGDGAKEIVAHSNDTKVYVFSSKTGRALATFGTSYPPSWHIERILNAAEAGRMAPGEHGSVVVTNHAAYVSVWDFVPSKSNGDRFTFEQRWERRLTEHNPNPSMDAKPVLVDLDGDEALEILAQTEDRGLFALRADGTTLWSHGWGGGNAGPAWGDVDGDGKPEAVFASDGGVVSVFDGRTGRPQWTFDVGSLGIVPGAIPIAPTIAELDGRPGAEILVMARDAHARDPDRWGENHVAVVAIHRAEGAWRGEALWVAQPTWAQPLSYTRLVVHDVDGDGAPEIFGMDWNTIGHYPGNFEHLGPAHVFALNSDGSERWVRELDAWWSNKDLVLADVDGDGKLELLANGARNGEDGLWVLDARNGKSEAFLGVAPWKLARGAVAFDLRGDNRMSLVVPVVPMEMPTTPRGALLVAPLGVPHDAPWPGR